MLSHRMTANGITFEVFRHGKRSWAEKPHVSKTETWGTHTRHPPAVICSALVLRVKGRARKEPGPPAQFLVVPAHQTILGATLEFIKLPSDVSGQILTKSSVARTFIVVETAPWIHPQYRGCLTLEIANVSNTPVLLYPGRLICQLILMSIAPTLGESEARNTDDRGNNASVKPDTNYFGPVYPEAPKFKNPEQDLLRIGVTGVSNFRRVKLFPKKHGWRESKPER